MSSSKTESLPLLAEAGGAGFKRFSGIVSEEFHPNLQGRQALRVYREMLDNDPLLGGAFRGMRMLVRQADWPVKPADDRRFEDAGIVDIAAARVEASRWAGKLESAMYDMEVSWRYVIDEMMSAFPYGFSLMWIAYKLRRGDNPSRQLNSRYDDGLWGWRSFDVRKQDTIERWLYAEDDETLIGAEQMAPPRYRLVPLPLERLIHLRFDSASGSPEGRSGFRNAYRSYYLKSLKEEIEGIGCARDLAGYPVITVPAEIMHPKASAEERAIRTMMENNVRKIKRDELEGLVMPSSKRSDGSESGFDFKLMSSGGSRQISLNESITRDRFDELASVQWESILLGGLPNGNRSLSSDKTDLASTALGGMMDAIVETLNLSAVARWCRLNRVPRHFWPEMSHGDIEKENIAEWMASLKTAADCGAIVTTSEDEKKTREKLGLEQRGPEDEILPRPADSADPFAAGPAPGAPPPPVAPVASELDPEDEPADDTAMTADEAAAWLNVPRSTIMRAIRMGRLPGAKIGNNYRILRSDLEQFMKPSPSST